MRCISDGCFAKVYQRNLCRNHYEMWRDQLPPPTGPGTSRKGTPMSSPAPTSVDQRFVNHRDRHGSSVCVCVAPITTGVPPFPGALMCVRCFKPPADSLTLNPPDRRIA